MVQSSLSIFLMSCAFGIVSKIPFKVTKIFLYCFLLRISYFKLLCLGSQLSWILWSGGVSLFFCIWTFTYTAPCIEKTSSPMKLSWHFYGKSVSHECKGLLSVLFCWSLCVFLFYCQSILIIVTYSKFLKIGCYSSNFNAFVYSRFLRSYIDSSVTIKVIAGIFIGFELNLLISLGRITS